jgi:hypothetical protein
MDNDVERLQAEVDSLRQQLDAKEPAKPRGHWVRTFWSAVLITTACLLAPLSVISVWARGEVTDTSRYVETVTPLASDPAIQNAVTNRITEVIFSNIDVEALTSDAVAAISANRDLSPQQTAALEALTGPLNQGIQTYTKDAVNAVVSSDQFEAAWVEANTLVHQRLQEALTGQNTDNAVRLVDDQVVLDLGNLVEQVKQILVDRGFTIAEKIPSTDATIVLFSAPNAPMLTTAYATLDTLGFWLPLIGITIAVIGIFLSHSRPKALAWFGFGLTLAMAVGAGLLAVGRLAYLDALPETADTAAATAFFDTFVRFLQQGLQAGAVAGLILLAGGLLLGRSRVADGVRRVPRAAASSIAGWLDGIGLHMGRVSEWVSSQATGLRIAASLATLVFVMLQRYKTPSLIVWSTVVLLAVLFVIQVLASGPREHGDGVGEQRGTAAS